MVDDTELIGNIQSLVTRISDVFPITYAGLDIIEDIDGKLWLIELNTTPQFGEFIKTNDSQLVKKIFRKFISFLQEKYVD